MNICIKTGNEHRTEFFEITHGDRWDRCLDCGEPVWAGYHDVGSGG